MLCINEAGQELRCADIAEDGGKNAVVGDCGQLKRHGNVEEPCEAGGGGKFLAALLLKHVNKAGHDAAAFDVDSAVGSPTRHCRQPHRLRCVEHGGG